MSDTPRTNAIAGKHLTIHSIESYPGSREGYVKKNDVYEIISECGKIERELAAANKRADEARAVALAAAKKACVDLVLLDIGTPPTGMDCAYAIAALTEVHTKEN